MASQFGSVENVEKEVDLRTLASFVMSKTRDTEMAILMNALQLACKLIARAVRKAGVANLYGLAGTANASGDDVKKLDVLSNEIMINALVNSCVCAVLVSEEEEDAIFVSPDKQGKYCVAFDPLDGSSNIDCNVSTGTIFSVYERLSTGTKPNLGDILRPGTDMVCAGYCMYGSACDFVVSFGKGVDRFTLDDSVGEFVHFGPMRFPDAPKTIYSCNEGELREFLGSVASVNSEREVPRTGLVTKGRRQLLAVAGGDPKGDGRVQVGRLSVLCALRGLDGVRRPPDDSLRRHLLLPGRLQVD